MHRKKQKRSQVYAKREFDKVIELERCIEKSRNDLRYMQKEKFENLIELEQ